MVTVITNVSFIQSSVCTRSATTRYGCACLHRCDYCCGAEMVLACSWCWLLLSSGNTTVTGRGSCRKHCIRSVFPDSMWSPRCSGCNCWLLGVRMAAGAMSVTCWQFTTHLTRPLLALGTRNARTGGVSSNGGMSSSLLLPLPLLLLPFPFRSELSLWSRLECWSAILCLTPLLPQPLLLSSSSLASTPVAYCC